MNARLIIARSWLTLAAACEHLNTAKQLFGEDRDRDREEQEGTLG
jgi:hypothetical protein